VHSAVVQTPKQTVSRILLGLLLGCWCACGAIPGSGKWEEASLRAKAQSELDCNSGALKVYRANAGRYTVRGCGRRATYLLQKCNRITRECDFQRDGGIALDVTSGGEAPPPPSS
jgi:hypothetical protein